MNVWQGIDPEEAEARLRGLNRRLAELDEALQSSAKFAADFPDSFSAKLSLNSLDQLNVRLQRERLSLVQYRKREKIVIALNGPSYADHTASLNRLGLFLIYLQKLFSSIGQAITTGPKARGPISHDIMNATNMRFADVFPSSFGIELYVDTDHDDAGESTAVASLQTMFNLLNSTQRQQEVARLSAELGQRSVNNLRRVLGQLTTSGAGFSMAWSDSAGTKYDWKVAREELPAISSNVARFQERKSEERTITGYLIGASLFRDRFEIMDGNRDVIEGKFTRAVKMKLHKLFGRPCIAKIDQVDIVEVLSGETKTYYTLIDIFPPEGELPSEQKPLL